MQPVARLGLRCHRILAWNRHLDTERLTPMPWSLGLLVLLACFAVKLLFKRGTRLQVVRMVRCGGRGRGRGGVVTVRALVTTTDEAQRSADATGLPRAHMRAGGPLPVIVALGVVGWLCWRMLVSRHHILDAWIVWTFDVLLVVVAVQLVVAGFEGRVIGRGETYRVVVLVPLYNGGSRRRGADALRPAARQNRSAALGLRLRLDA